MKTTQHEEQDAGCHYKELDFEKSGNRDSRAHSLHSVGHLVAEDEQNHVKRNLSGVELALTEDALKTRETLTKVDYEESVREETESNLDDEHRFRRWQTYEPQDAARKLDTNLDTGLSCGEAERRLVEHGPNSLDPGKPRSLVTVFLMQFANLIVMLLIVASIAAFSIKHTAEGIAILIIITLNATIATFQERKAGNALAALSKLSSPKCIVIRDGAEMVLDTDQLVPGDIVQLIAGDIIPADILLIKSNDLLVNEMLLTGESKDVNKKAKTLKEGADDGKLTPSNMCFSSTTVTEGKARALVVETGMNTKVGKIARLLKGKQAQDEQPKSTFGRFVHRVKEPFIEQKASETPLQRALHRLGAFMGVAAISCALVVFIIGVVRNVKDPQRPDQSVAMSMLMVSVSLAVSAIPEGLPMVVTICLTVGTSQMVKEHVIVRRLAATETLGSANVICSDKTGTLTQGNMTAVKIWGAFNKYRVTGKGMNPIGKILPDESTDDEEEMTLTVQLKSLLSMALLCSNTTLKQETDEKGQVTWSCIGNSTEAPLVVCAAKVGIGSSDVNSMHMRVTEVPFSSSRKMMGVLVEAGENHTLLGMLSLGEGARYAGIVKGAPNVVLQSVRKFVDTDGSVKVLTAEERMRVMEFVDQMSDQALRVLAVAYKPFNGVPWQAETDRGVDVSTDAKMTSLVSGELILAGLFASIDPERDGVKEAIQEAREAGVRTMMITGDYVKTAVAIARNIGLLKPIADASVDEVELGELSACDCSELRPKGSYLPENEIDELTSRTAVFARARPEDKLEIVKSLKRQGLCAAMTGDGVNDAPALKESNIGVAMGITGTEVAKGASDMILTDDNFCSIVSAIRKGRIIYENIQKFVVFLLSTNFGEILLILVTVAIGMPIPLEPLQILVLNLLSDGMPAVALSLEKGDHSIMKEKPRPKDQYIINGKLMWIGLILNAIIIFGCSFTVYAVIINLSIGTIFQEEMIDVERVEDPDYAPVCDRWSPSTGWQTVGDSVEGGPQYDISEKKCAGDGIAHARTATFIAITMAEVLRSFTVRNFRKPFWHKFFENKFLFGAAFASVCITTFLIVVGPIADVFGFVRIPYWQVLIAVSGSLLTLILAEVAKCGYSLFGL